jgi:hypothetical protein
LLKELRGLVRRARRLQVAAYGRGIEGAGDAVICGCFVGVRRSASAWTRAAVLSRVRVGFTVFGLQ